MDLVQTENARLTQETHEFFYIENLIVARLDMDWFYYATLDDVFNLSRWLRRFQVVCQVDLSDANPESLERV
jgi:hypothetical protein